MKHNLEAGAPLSDCRIIERGTHDSLLAQRGFYHDLYMGQFTARAMHL